MENIAIILMNIVASVITFVGWILCFTPQPNKEHLRAANHAKLFIFKVNLAYYAFKIIWFGILTMWIYLLIY